MNNSNPFLRFINLVSLDQKIQSFVQKKESCQQAARIVQHQKNEHDTMIIQAEQHIRQLKKNVDAQELEMKVLDNKENDKKNRLNMLSDYRECQAIKQEIELIQRQQLAQEQAVLNAWTELENAQTHLEKKQAINAALLQEHDQLLQKIEDEKQALDTEIEDLMKARAEKMVDIPDEWLEKYELMSKQVANPVVPIEYNSCSGCYQQITQQDQIRARHGALMQCKKCFRLLYLPEMMNSN